MRKNPKTTLTGSLALTAGVVCFSPKGSPELPEGGLSGGGGGSRRLTAYINTQLMELKKEYHYNKYICRPRREKIAALLDLTQRLVKVWFQNRRMKHKRQTKDTHAELSKINVGKESGAKSEEDVFICGPSHGRLIFGVVAKDFSLLQKDLSTGCKDNDIKTS